MKVARILQVLGVLTAILLLSGQVMVLAGNDTTLQGKPLSDVELQSFHGMGWTINLTQTNLSTGTDNNQKSTVSGFTTTYTWKDQGTKDSTINLKTVTSTANVRTFQHH
jgi:hypothetical protein